MMKLKLLNTPHRSNKLYIIALKFRIEIAKELCLHSAVTCSKLAIKTLEQSVKYFQS